MVVLFSKDVALISKNGESSSLTRLSGGACDVKYRVFPSAPQVRAGSQAQSLCVLSGVISNRGLRYLPSMSTRPIPSGRAYASLPSAEKAKVMPHQPYTPPLLESRMRRFSPVEIL